MQGPFSGYKSLCLFLSSSVFPTYIVLISLMPLSQGRIDENNCLMLEDKMTGVTQKFSDHWELRSIICLLGSLEHQHVIRVGLRGEVKLFIHILYVGLGDIGSQINIVL